MKGLFVTGTDTNVGKTVVSAALLSRFRVACACRYWKPIQTGCASDDDTATVRHLSGGTAADILDRGVRLQAPVSPHLAARTAGEHLEIEPLAALLRAQHAAGSWVVEGAGGVLVPINETQTMADLMVAMALPVVVVARTTLGTINQTLLTIEALRRRSLTVAGVVMVGEPNDDNRASIELYGDVKVAAVMPWFDPLEPQALMDWAVGSLDGDGALQAWMR